MLKRCMTAVVLGMWMAAGGMVADAYAAKPNILLISIDDLNDWVGVLGGHPQAKTPNIDRLAREGVLFANAHCQAPVCTPSRASLVLSKYPTSTRLYFLTPHIHQVEDVRGKTTLVQRFAKEGYKTVGVGKVYGGAEARYFQIYGGNFGGFGPRPAKKLSYPMGHPLWDWGAFPENDSLMPDVKIADWAVKQLQEKHDQPFFLAVGFYRPHVPMYAPRKWFDMHPLEKIELPKTLDTDRDDLSQYAKDLTFGYPAPRHEWFVQNNQWKHAVQAYLASSTFVDHCVGMVVDALRTSRYRDNTIVVLFSDHGWHLGEKQRWAKRSLWEDATRVPMIVAAPGCKKGGVSPRPVGLIDIFPTLLELCGLKPDGELEGQSLVPLLRKPDADWQKPALTTFGPNNHAVRSTRWRYIRYSDGSEELYDHEKDPHEWHNLAGKKEYARVIEEHRKWLPKTNPPVLERFDSYGLDAYRKAEKGRKAK
ncbi:MAG: choline-sulfatase [Gemmatales bacterium]|nr:MAG: choline-sulfatase [Gemmatales bacterium]